jgi:threonine/homoserine/homoserine lactone efflux protein
MMLKAIIEGSTYGLFLAILVGPLLMTLVNTSIKSGYKKGLAVASGIWISDLIFILILFNLSKEFSALLTEGVLKVMALISGITFIAVGINYIVKTKSSNEAGYKVPDTYVWQTIKGFMINTINPFTFVFWTTLSAKNVLFKKYDSSEGLAFFSSIIAVIIITDTLKVLLADKISNILKSHIVVYLQYFTATIFILSGSYILFKFLF